MYWWGGKERADRTFKVNELYIAANPGMKIDGETLGWGDYWAASKDADDEGQHQEERQEHPVHCRYG